MPLFRFPIKLLINRPSQKVMYAEAGKEVVDSLLGILGRPLGSIVNILSKDRMVGISRLHQSLERLDENYLQSKQTKADLLSSSGTSSFISPSLLARGEAKGVGRCYMCTYDDEYSDNSATEEGGYLKGDATYTIMDDLTVTPRPSLSGIHLLNKFNVKDLSSIQEKTVTFGNEEGMELLKASLESDTVLTDVFLRNKRLNKRHYSS